MITSQVDADAIEELFRERIIPYLGTAETQKALTETEWVYRSLCDHQPARENQGFLYQKLLAAYEFIRPAAAKQATLDCIQFLNTQVRNNPALT